VTLHDQISRVLQTVEGLASAIEPNAKLAESQAVAIENIRHIIVESIRGVLALKSQFSAVKRTSNTLVDLSRRCELIALNASINPHGLQKKGGEVISDELTTISERAKTVAAELSALNELWLKDSTLLENVLKSAGKRCFDIARNATFAGEGRNQIENLTGSLEVLRTAFGRLVNGPNDIASRVGSVLENSFAGGPSLSEMETALVGLIHIIDELSVSRGKREFDGESVNRDKKTFDLIDHAAESPEISTLAPTGLS
ncbi:MAG: hypothetical protein ABI539_04455, partial [Acidobacteriota bacterium]